MRGQRDDARIRLPTPCAPLFYILAPGRLAGFVPSPPPFARVFARMFALALAISLAGTHEARSVEHHAAVTAQAAERHATMMRSLVRRGDPAAVAYVVRSVRDGLPPPALHAFLEAAQAHPHPAYAAPLRELASYRSPTLRARALLAMAAIDELEARRAVLAALGDPDVRIRLLGLELAETHTTPELEEAALRLLDRDAEVAAAFRAARGVGPRRSDR